MREEGKKVVAVNRKARHEYEIEESHEAGIVLTGTEIKSIREGKANLQDAFARIEGNEVWVHHMHISPYEAGNRYNVDPVRPRKLLLHRREIERLRGKVEQRGLTLIPLQLYLRGGRAKIELGLARGKRLYDRREEIAKRTAARDVERAMRERD
ncbi:MAG TPA: SsrA-binding protein SmpB [Armatimonadota bacterium]|jgi:SsrA-binding protein|nr:SsrA-binding protein SmpB [Armatimonadota bacterium]HOJ21671.1 SsrA-binding protein SmpB [Armatimonadota bacterium]HOM82264.1 SsrA-binding protein SmpB [Armatimonadota bacterium]